MARPLSQLWRFLLSRRLAVYLLIALVLYAWAATLIPLGDTQLAEVKRWIATHPGAARWTVPLGLHRPFTHPVFLIIAGLLTASTVACSWQRTNSAFRSFRSIGVVTPGLAARLKTTPDVRIVPESTPSLESLSATLESAGFKVRQGPSLVEGRSRLIGLIGSPLFHWSLAALFLIAGVSQLTRAEGWIGVRVGGTKPDARASYLPGSDAGALFPGYTGVVFSVPKVAKDLVVGGVPRGSAPYVRINRGGKVLTGQYVYPNHPLRFGSMMVHRRDAGRAVMLRAEAGGQRTPAKEVLFLPEPSSPTGMAHVVLDLNRRSGGPLKLRIDPLAGARIKVSELDAEGGVLGIPKVIGEGQAAPVDGGEIDIIADSFDNYVMLTIVHDWSIYPIYALFVTATLGIAFVLLWPARIIRGTVVDGAYHLVTDMAWSDRFVVSTIRRKLGDATILDQLASEANEASTQEASE